MALSIPFCCFTVEFSVLLIREQVQWHLLFDREQCYACTARTQSVSFGCVVLTHNWRKRRWTTVKTIPHLPALTSKVWQMNVKLKAFNGWSQRAQLATSEKNTIISLCCRLFCRQITPFNMPKVNLHHTEWNSHNLLIFLFLFCCKTFALGSVENVCVDVHVDTKPAVENGSALACAVHMDIQDVKTNSCFNAIILVFSWAVARSLNVQCSRSQMSLRLIWIDEHIYSTFQLIHEQWKKFTRKNRGRITSGGWRQMF